MSGLPVLRIAHVSATFPPYHGGTGNVCFHNARVLADRGHQVSVFTATTTGRPEDPPGVTVHRLRPLVRIGNAPVLPQLFRLHDFDLLHLHFPFYSGGDLVALNRTPFVVTYHQDVKIDGLLGRVAAAHDRRIGRWVLRRAARICPTSLDYARHSTIASLAAEHGHPMIPLPNGVDVERFRPGPVDLEFRARFGLPAEAVVVLFVGAMDAAHHFKGVKVLLRAIAACPEVWGLLVGDGDLKAGYQRHARELGIASRVVFAGHVPTIDLPSAYRAADVLVLPSITAGEAFGMVLLEAMATGRPVIASDLPGVRSVFTAGAEGLRVPPGDAAALASAIQTLSSMGTSGRAAMGRRGRETTEHEYSWDQIGRRLEDIYTGVVTERRYGRMG